MVSPSYYSATLKIPSLPLFPLCRPPKHINILSVKARIKNLLKIYILQEKNCTSNLLNFFLLLELGWSSFKKPLSQIVRVCQKPSVFVTQSLCLSQIVGVCHKHYVSATYSILNLELEGGSTTVTNVLQGITGTYIHTKTTTHGSNDRPSCEDPKDI